MNLTARIEEENSRHTRIGVWQDGGKAGVLVVESTVAHDVVRVLNVAGLIEPSFALSIRLFQTGVHINARDKGFWDEGRSDIGMKLSLVHGEVSELVEAFRQAPRPSAKIPQFSNEEEEAADIVIRVLDLAEEFGWNLQGAMLAKHQYNIGREKLHGKRF